MFLRFSTVKTVCLAAVIVSANQIGFAQPNSENVINNLTNAVQYAKGKGGSPVKDGTGSGGGSNGGGSTVDPSAAVENHFNTKVHPLVYPRCYSACHQSGGVGQPSGLVFVPDSEPDQVAGNYLALTSQIMTSTGASILDTIAGSGHDGGTIYSKGTTEHDQFVTLIELMQEAGML